MDLTPHPEQATSVAELAEQLDLLRKRTGHSLRYLERWARQHLQAEAGLSKTAVGDVLSGKRVPSVAFLVAYLEACNVTGAGQEPWLLARADILRAVPPASEPAPPASVAARTAADRPAADPPLVTDPPLLAPDSADRLTALQVDRAGGGLKAAELPPERRQLGCVRAIRLAQDPSAP